MSPTPDTRAPRIYDLADAVAVGQVRTGPVFPAATFIGYALAGMPGAVLATVAIFMPGFALVAMTRPPVTRVRLSRNAAAFLNGVNVASLALMAVVTAQLERAALMDWPAVAVAVAAVSAVLLVRFKVNPTRLIAGEALVGALAHGVR